MAREGSDKDIVSEYLAQNPQLAQWVDTLRGYCETSKQWCARREFILRNMENFPTVKPGAPSNSLDRLLSLSMVWTNHVFLGCRWDTQSELSYNPHAAEVRVFRWWVLVFSAILQLWWLKSRRWVRGSWSKMPQTTEQPSMESWARESGQPQMVHHCSGFIKLLLSFCL